MSIFEFEHCCGCIDLKVGCFILGYLNLVAEVIMTILSFMGLMGGIVLINQGNDEQRSAGVLLVAICALMLIFLVLFLAFTIVLLVGLHKDKPGHLKAYLVYSCIFIVISILGFFISLAHPVASSIIQNIIVILLNIYFTLVIRSYYLKLKAHGPAIFNTV